MNNELCRASHSLVHPGSMLPHLQWITGVNSAPPLLVPPSTRRCGSYPGVKALTSGTLLNLAAWRVPGSYLRPSCHIAHEIVTPSGVRLRGGGGEGGRVALFTARCVCLCVS